MRHRPPDRPKSPPSAPGSHPRNRPRSRPRAWCRLCCALACGLLAAPSATAQDAQSTFGHARARRLAGPGELPPARDIVVRALVNYHRDRVPLPTHDQAVALELRVDRRDVRPGEVVWVQVGYATLPQGDRALAEPCAVALVVDCSGSMQERDKMAWVQRGLTAFVDRLRPADQVALVAFADEARVVAPLQRRGDGRWLADAIARLAPGGNTDLHAGMGRALG